MSIPAQGAVGAETMTAAERVCHEEQMVIWSSEMAERLAMGNWLRERLSYEDKLGFYADLSQGIRDIVESAFDLSTPALRTDGGMTAGAVDWRKVMRDLIAEHDKHICPHEETHRGGAIWTICDHCRRKWADDEGGFQPYEEPAAVTAAWALLKCEDATPAQPAGAVPDGLRALSEIELRSADAWLENKRKYEHSKVAQTAIDAARAAIRALLASHPAGQSAGSGAEKASESLRPDWHRAMFPDDETPEQGALCPVCGSTPENLNEFGGWCEGVLTSQGDHTGICAKHGEPARPPAPDSTRTGQGEAEELREEVAYWRRDLSARIWAMTAHVGSASTSSQSKSTPP